MELERRSLANGHDMRFSDISEDALHCMVMYHTKNVLLVLVYTAHHVCDTVITHIHVSDDCHVSCTHWVAAAGP